MDEKIKSAIDKILILTKQNEEFNKELRKALNIAFPADTVSGSYPLQHDIKAIREALDIRGNNSISYDFIRQQRLRDQLLIDNLRMENAALNLTEKEQYRFYVFCVNAFYQIENVINYYYFTSCPDIKDLVKVIEHGTLPENPDYQFHVPADAKIKTVADIAISHKLNAFCNTFFPGDRIKIDYSNLRRVRNEGEHRCMIIMEDKDETNSIYKFFKLNTFNSVRFLLEKLVNTVKQEVENRKQIRTAEIINLLPSACFIKYENKTIQLPTKLLYKVRDKSKGDKVSLSIKGNAIIDIC